MHPSCFEWFDDPCERLVLAPCVEQAADELAGTCFHRLLAPECQRAQLKELAYTLRTYAEDTFAHLVATNLAPKNSLWAIDARLAPATEWASAKEEVAASMEASHGTVLDEAAPLLREKLTRQTRRFVRVSQETCERIWHDRHTIASELLDRDELGLVTKMDASLADCHDGGRRTTVVTCGAGRFVYKPHDCRIDVWFKDLADRFMPGALAQPKTILRQDETDVWAFQEFMARIPAEDEGGISRYWHNMGRAAALFQALGSEDLHYENFVAVGETPSLIDCETVITSDPAVRGDPLTCPNISYASKGFGHDLASTLLTSALLPRPVWTLVRDGSDGREDIGNSSPLLAHGHPCLPLQGGEERDVLGHEDDLLDGFDKGLMALECVADDLAADVRLASDIPVRRLIRDTGVYVRLLARLRKADAYVPTVRERILDALHRPLVRGQASTRSPLAQSEAACLRVGDVPYFYAAANSREIMGSDGTVDDRLLENSAIGRALLRIGSLDASHRTFAHKVLEANIRRAILPSERDVPACEVGQALFGVAEALEEAERIFWTLDQLVITSPSGEESWLFRSLDKGVLGRSTVALSDGLGGTAVFLAALASRTTSDSARERALELLGGCLARLDETLAVLETAKVVPEDSVGLGLADGFGGIVRTLDIVARTLGDSDANGKASAYATVLLSRTVAVLGKAGIEDARRTDVYVGAAGLLLALAQCTRIREDERARSVCERLVRFLLDRRTLSARDGTPLWNTAGTRWPVSGFGHGQAGIAAALACGSHACCPNAADAASSALRWELATYSDKLGTWPDLRESPASGRFMHGICSGAPGVGLAALIVRAATTRDEQRTLAEELLARTDHACRTIDPVRCDTLCCGNASAVEYLVSRGLLQDAGRLLKGMVRRARALGHYVLARPGARLVDEPDLFNGLSGIGYELLRYADPTLPGIFVG